MTLIFTAIAPLFLIILASAFFKKYAKVGDEWEKVMNEFALRIGLPVLIFLSLARTSFSFTEKAPVVLANSVLMLISFALAFIISKALKLDKQMFRTLFICLGFGNVAYLGIPVMTQVYGDAILPDVSIIIAIYLFWLFTVGTGYLDFLKEKRNSRVLKTLIRNFLKNPLILSVILGIGVGMLKITLPSTIISALDMISASVTPTVLIVIGLFIGKSKIGKLHEWFPVAWFAFGTLIVMPAILYLAIKHLGYSPSEFNISIIEAAMPLAITPFALADKYKLNKVFISRAIVMSTILSVISLPFWASIV
jgi:predicted permease